MAEKKDGQKDAQAGGRSRGMQEPKSGKAMPDGAKPDLSSGTDAAGAMPVPGMKGGASTGDMPSRGMQEPDTAGPAMPGASMSEPKPGTTMPSGVMVGGGGSGRDAQRFGPPQETPGDRPPAQWDPGVVEVQFRDGVAPTIATASDVRSTGSASAAVTSRTGADLTEFNRIVQAHGLQQAEPTLQTLAEEANSVQASARQLGMEVPNLASFVTLHFPDGANTPQIARELEQLPEVLRAVPVPIAVPPQTPLNEPLVGASDQVIVDPTTGFQNQWYVFRCRANQAWSMASGAGVVIADVDWGYRTTHQDLASQLDLTRAFNSVDGGTNVSFGSNTDHGTGVMGLAGAADNNLGMAGIAWGASLWPVQANAGPGTALGGNSWARGIDWVRTTDSGGRRKVVILEVQTGSFGNYEQVPSVNAAIQTAIAAGVVVCVAAGNGNRDASIDDSGNPIPPTGSILVGATAFDATQNVRAGFSNWGTQITVAAPGDGSNDLTCAIGSDSAYRNGFGGTSGATPKVAATAALMLSVNPTLTHAQIRAALNSTGTTVVTDAGRPVGTFLNCEAAVRSIRSATAGRLEVFARGGDQALWHKWQTAPNNGWGGWESLGGWIDLLSIGQNADGRLEAFVRGGDRAVWHKWQVTPGGAWSGWASRGGWIDILTVGRNEDGRLEVFARGADAAVWHQWQTAPNNGWSGWASLGGWIDRLTIGNNADGRLEIFARGADGAVWHKWQTAPNNGWSGWASLGGWIDLLAIGQNADGRLEIFARGADGAVWHKWQTAPNNGWSGWASLGGWIDLLAIGRNADGRLEIFARGADGAVWHKWQTAPNNGWSGWASLGGWIDRLAVGKNADGRLEIFARGADGAVWHKWQTAPNNGWSGWASLGGWIDLLSLGQNSL